MKAQRTESGERLTSDPSCNKVESSFKEGEEVVSAILLRPGINRSATCRSGLTMSVSEKGN